MTINENDLVAKGALALKEHMDALDKSIKDGDALLQAKMEKCSAQVTTTIEELQKISLAQKAQEQKAADLEAAISRVGNVAKSEADRGAELRHEAFNQFVRKGAVKGSASAQVSLESFMQDFAESKGLDLKALSVNSNVDGGFLVLPEFGGVMETQIFESSPIRLYADTVNIGTDAYEFVDDYDQPTSAWVSETGTRSVTNTPQLAKRHIATHEISANPQVTQKMIEDSVVNIESWLAGKVAAEFGRKEATAFVTGDGVGKPRGFTTYAAGSSTYTQGQIEQVNGGSTSGFTYDGLVNTLSALKVEYLQGAIWAGARATIGALLKVKDGELRPIFNMSYDKNTRTFGNMLGMPVAIFNDMAAISSASLSLALGDFRKGYKIVDRRGINVLRDPYTNKPFVGFYTTKRVGGDVANWEAIKLVKCST
jgi:HK97 family phage major capsid protein